MKNHYKIAITLSTFGIGFAAIAYVMTLGLGIPFHFDSFPNLRPLETVHNLQSGMLFIFSGGSGPLGRPISLATFLLQIDAWPNSPASFLTANVAIHLANGVLLFGIAFLISRKLQLPSTKSLIVATTASLLWLVCPILLSTTFSVIQRMTSLCAFFMLAGLLSHLVIRDWTRYGIQPRILLLTFNLLLFTGLAALSKENGLLLPILILALETTILPTPTAISSRAWRAWKIFFLMLPLGALVAYLISRIPYPDYTLTYRGFSAIERLLTQCTVLWEYLLHSIIPATRHIGFFHDDYSPASLPPDLPSILAMISWLIVISSAFYFQKIYPLYSFAVFWFLGGHLIESTVLPLELYFEHRNYIPLIGPILALSIAVVRLPVSTRRIAYCALTLFWVSCIFVSSMTLSLWSRPLDAADFWLERKPDSERAVSYYVREQISAGNPLAALGAIDRARRTIDAEPFFTLSEIWVRCNVDMVSDSDIQFDQVLERAPNAPFRFGTVAILQELYEMLYEGTCGNISKHDLLRAADMLLDNHRYRSLAQASHPLNRLIANLHYDREEFMDAIEHYEEAVLVKPNVPIVQRLRRMYIKNELYSRGCNFFDKLVDAAPLHPYIRMNWISHIEANKRELGRASTQGDCRYVSEA